MSDPRLTRIAEIDSMFDDATSWGSWMATVSKEREGLVNQLRAQGHQIEHKHQIRYG